MTYSTAPLPPQGLDAFGAWMNEVFRLWSQRWQVYVLQGLVFFGIILVPTLIIIPIVFASVMGGSDLDPTSRAGLEVIRGIVSIIQNILQLLLLPGIINTALKQIRGQEIGVGDLFSGVRYWWGALVVGLLSGVGCLGCGVGYFVITGLLMMAVPIMIDQNPGTIRAISLSWETTVKNFWLFVLFSVVMGIISGLGFIACCIGIYATLSFYSIAQALAYERTFCAGRDPYLIPSPVGAAPPPPYVPTVGAAPQGTEQHDAVHGCRWCGAALAPGQTRCAQCGREQAE